jgi:diguanylate cyclase (GGDEF)-like protein
LLFGVLALAGILLVGGLSWFLASKESSSRRSLAQRFQARTELGAESVSLYVGDLIAREHREAFAWLAARTVTPRQLERAATGLGVSYAALIGDRARLLDLTPSPSRSGALPVSARLTALAARLSDAGGVSDLIRSPAGESVAVEAPFRDTAGDVRVLSGAYRVSQTPLGSYLNHMIATPGRRVYLLDAHGAIVTGTRASAPGAGLTGVEPRLAHAIRNGASGGFQSPGGAQQFVRTPVRGTPWQIVVVVPQAQLFASVNSTEWLAWGGVAGFALAGLATLLLIVRLSRSRRRLVMLNRELERLAHIDSLTELKNRRALEEALVESLSAARRHDHELSLMMIDVDHFKDLNDTHGHRTGDEVLRRVARELDDTRRGEDVIGRWGGEEFLIILPRTDEAGAVQVAERLRSLVSGLRIDAKQARGLGLTVTVGVAQWGGESCEELLDRADAALYAGKAAGRNVVRRADPRSRRAVASLARIA